MPYYNTGATYDSGLRYAGGAALPKKHMSKVKIELQQKSDTELRDYALNHKTKMAGNANYPAPDPAPAVFDPAAQAFADKLAEITALENTLAQKRSEKDALRTALEGHLTARAAHVQTASGGDPAKIQSAGLDLQSAATPTTSMPQPKNAVATTGDMAGEVDLACDAVPRTKTYLWECRTHEDGQAPGAWVSLKPAGRSTATATGLVPGKEYAFRVQVLGPNETISPWSDECIARAA
jgi:hypothetical protein